jgi:predicted transcriptional regulator
MSKESKVETISTKVTPTVKKKLEAIAKKKDRKLSYVVNQAVMQYVGLS